MEVHYKPSVGGFGVPCMNTACLVFISSYGLLVEKPFALRQITPIPLVLNRCMRTFGDNKRENRLQYFLNYLGIKMHKLMTTRAVET